MGVTRPGPAGDETSKVFMKPESCRGLEFYNERMMLTAMREGGCVLDWLEFSMGEAWASTLPQRLRQGNTRSRVLYKKQGTTLNLE